MEEGGTGSWSNAPPLRPFWEVGGLVAERALSSTCDREITLPDTPGGFFLLSFLFFFSLQGWVKERRVQ